MMVNTKFNFVTSAMSTAKTTRCEAGMCRSVIRPRRYFLVDTRAIAFSAGRAAADEIKGGTTP